MELRKINMDDAYAQWQYTTNLPEDENGLTNPYQGVSYDEYIKNVLPELISFEHPVDMPEWFVPETYYYLWDGDKLVGEFRIRHYLTEALRNGAGHIGYSISREYRGKGYGTEGLRLTIEKAKEIVPEKEIYLRVLKDNPASQKVMLKNGAYKAGEDEEHFFMRIREVLHTERLILRPMMPGDEREVHEYAGDRDITMMFFLPNDTFDETCGYVRRSAEEWNSKDQTDFEFVLVLNGRIIGGCDCDLGHSADRTYATLGWIINREFRNRGYASEAASAVMSYAFENLNIEKIYAQCDINNPASLSVMKKIGMTCINDKGTRTYPKTGHTSGEYTCMITREEWQFCHPSIY